MHLYCRRSHGALTLRDDVPWVSKGLTNVRPPRCVDLPSVNYTWDPSQDPEKNVDAEIFSKHLSGRSDDVISGINAPAPKPRSTGKM